MNNRPSGRQLTATETAHLNSIVRASLAPPTSTSITDTTKRLRQESSVPDATSKRTRTQTTPRFTKDICQCCACRLDRTTEHFSVARLRSHRHGSKALKCELCERPPCRVCGNRPVRPLTNPHKVVKSLTDRAAYRCTACKYPLCSVCRVSQRPCHNHIYSVDVMAKWTCSKCKQKE